MRRLYGGTPVGTRDILWDDCEAFRELEHIISDKFKASGFKEIRTPMFEYYDLFVRTGFPIPQEAMQKVMDRSGQILVCRPDSTTPVARFAASRPGIRPLKLFYIQPVFRSDKAHTGRSVQTLQAGIEWIGGSESSDLEVVSLAKEVMASLGAGEAHFELGHAGIFKELTAAMGGAADIEDEMRELIDRKNFAALNDLFESRGGETASKRYSKLMSMYGGAGEIAEAKRLLPGSKALDELEGLAVKLGGEFSIDFGLLGDMDYYTGLIFRGYLPGAADAVLTGGRYDNLMSGFGMDEPAVGFAINLDAALRAKQAGRDV